MYQYNWIIISCVSGALPSLFIKKYTKSKDYKYLYPIFLFYLILIISYINLYENNEVSQLYPMLKVIQVMLIITFSILFLEESLDKNKIIGICSGLTCIYFLA